MGDAAGAARAEIYLSFPAFFLWVGGLAPIGSATLIELAVDGRRGLRSLFRRFVVKGVP